MTDPKPVSTRTALLTGAGLVLGVFLADVLTLMAPGISVDEAIYTYQAQQYVEKLGDGGLASLVDEESPHYVFAHLRARVDHPPLGRFWLGLIHAVFSDGGLSLFGMRMAAAVAFAALAGIVYWMALRWVGFVGAIVSTVSLVLMPRLFGHAHFATMEPVMCLTFVAAIGSAGWALVKPSYVRSAIAGVLFGLALLTKMQAVLIPVVVLPWALWLGRKRAIGPILVWGLVGGAVFFAGWPWLWHDPIGRLKSYLSTGTKRDVIWLYYFGRKYQDVAVPWHYPFVMTALTVPVGLLALSVAGGIDAVRKLKERPMPVLWLAVVALFLIFFAVPGIPIYDGVRHLLPALVFLTLLIGVGAQWLLGWRPRHLPRWVPHALLTGLLVTQAYGTVAMHPFQLSYYNLLAGGTAGAQRSGMTVTYWAEAIDDALLDRVAAAARPGEKIGVAPVLIDAMPQIYGARPAFKDKGLSVGRFDGGDCIVLVPRDGDGGLEPKNVGPCDIAIVLNRRAYIDQSDGRRDVLDLLREQAMPLFPPQSRASAPLVFVYRLRH